MFKTHLLPRWLPRVGRRVYLVRDGADVLASYHAFYRSHLGYRGTFEEFFERFLAGRLQYGAWADHVTSWLALEHRPDVLIVAYEDLSGAFDETVRRLARFLELPLDDELMARVRERCSLEWMKRHETRFDHITSLLKERGLEPGSFVRRGRVGEGGALLDDEQRRALERARRRRGPVLPERRLADFLR